MCIAEVMRTMHQRAADVRLMPHIQMSCISDISAYCTDKSEPGEVISFMIKVCFPLAKLVCTNREI
jgi:hypothetical protein